MEFKTASIAELHKFADEKREELRVLRFEGAGSKNRNVKAVRELRKEVARALTEVSSKQAAASN